MTKRPPKGSIRFSITLSEEQKVAKEQMLKHPFSFVHGNAGSGKTLLAVQVALDQFFKRQYNKIIITRPTVATEDNGFLPGSEKEKMEPWLVPIKSNMRKVYNKPELLEKLESEEQIELVSLSHFRGRTFDNSVVSIIPATDAAFSRATLVTFLGSTIPASNISTNSSVLAL